jgi:hypothetical protein
MVMFIICVGLWLWMNNRDAKREAEARGVAATPPQRVTGESLLRTITDVCMRPRQHRST